MHVTGATHTAAAATAVERLTPEQRHALSNVAASFAMENMDLDLDHLEILAEFTLGTINGETTVERLNALGR